MLGNAPATPKWQDGVPPTISKDHRIDHKTYKFIKKIYTLIAFFAFRHCKVTNTYQHLPSATLGPLKSSSATTKPTHSSQNFYIDT